jgi:uroporphyrinogen decarboxylase
MIRNGKGRIKFFRLDHARFLWELHSGLEVAYYELKGQRYTYFITPIIPRYESRIIGEDEHSMIMTNEAGQKMMIHKVHAGNMPMYLDYPVRDKASWETIKKRLNPESAGRWPVAWDEYVKKFYNRDYPVGLSVGSFFGFLREWTGLERLLFWMYDEPSLVEDMMDHMVFFEGVIIKRVLKNIKIDFAFLWEDMAYKAGPMISPEMFRKFVMPRCLKITELLRREGVDIIFVDSDGNIDKLIPLWLECGVNGFWPLEVAAGMDAVAIRKKYGKEVILAGNIDKRQLTKGRDSIRNEVMAKVPFLLEQSGYFPCIDHLVPPDVPFENFIYFLNLVREICGLEKIDSYSPI